MAKNRVRIVTYLYNKNPVCKPSLSVWIMVLSLDYVTTVLSATCSSLQVLRTLLSQQDAQFKLMCASLSEMCTIYGPL